MSYSLEGLLRRLKRMPPRGFAVLDDAVIRAPAVTRLFGALLGFPGDALPVQSWLLRPAGDVSVVTEVELVGEVPFFGVENARAAFAFTLDEAGELRLVLRCILGPMTVADMLAGGLLPGSAWAAGPAAAALAGFPRVAFTLDSAGSTLRVQGAPSLAGWDVGLPGTALGPVSPDIVRSAPPPPAPPLWDPGFTTSLSVGSLGLPVRVAVPAGLSGWKVALADPAGVAVGDLSALDPLLGGAGAALPGPLAGMGQLRVTSLDLGFAAQAPRTWTVAAELSVGAPGAGDGPVWRLVPGVVELDRLQARLAWTLVSLPGGVFSASAAGTVTGQVTVLGQPAAATLPVPAGPDGWLLEVPASITLPGLADLAPYFGGQDYLGAALAPLGTLQGLVLAWVSARFDPEAFSFTEVSFALEAASWSVPALPWFRAGGIALDAVVTRPLDPAARVVRVAAAAVLSLGPLPELLLTGGYDGATGLLDMEWTGMPFEPMPLADLAALVTADELAAAVPAGLPTGGAFNLGRLAFRYDTGWQSLQRVELSLGSAAPWTLVPDVLVLESFDLALALAWSAAGAPATVTGAVTAPLRLGDAEVLLEAARPAAGEPWTFSASLSTDAEVDFAALLAQLGAGAVLPGGWGFPASLTLQALDVVLVPSVPSLTVNGAAFLDWSVPFAGGAFTLGGVEGMLELAPGRTSAWIAGTFRLAGLSGAATLALGGPGGAVRVAVEVADAGAVSPAAQVDALCGAGAWAAVPAPAGFATPSFFSAGMLLDLTAGSYLVHGEFGRGAGGLYGAVVLLVQQDASGAWGFALAAGLESWTFADLSPALAGVDAVLGVERAGAAVALTSLQGSAAAQAIAPWIPALAGELTDGPGLYFRATLDFATGLTAQLVPLLDVSAAGPFTVQGYLPGGAGAATFTATLGSLTLLGALSFRDVVLVYRVDGGRTLTLTGTIALSVPLLQGTAPLVFAGAMTVDDEEAVFQAATTQSVASPLGIPGVTLEELALTLDRDFAGGGATTLSLEGSVQLGGVGLAGRVVFQDGAAVVSVVSLTRPLPVGAVFAGMLGASWPAGLPDLTLSDGSIWYAPRAVSAGGGEWSQGLHATAMVSVPALGALRLQAAMTAAGDGRAAGMTASAQTARPIDWGFVTFYDPAAPALGPRLSIDSAADVFAVDCGVRLLGAEAATTLKATPDGLAGSLTVDTGDLFGTQTLAFTWSDADGFQVTEWPLPDLPLPPFSFTDIPGGGACSQVVVAALPIDTRFNFQGSLGVRLAPSPVLTIGVSGSFDLVCNSSAYPGALLTAQVADLTVDVPFPGTGGFTWQALGDALVDGLRQATGSIFRNLVEDPENLAKLLAVGGVQFAAGQVADFLVCRGGASAAARAAANAFASAATSAVKTTVDILGVAVAVGGVIGAIIDGIFRNSGSSSGSLLGSLPPAAPAAPALAWRDGALEVTWDAVAGADGYAVSYQSGGPWTSTGLIAGTSVSLAVPAGPLYTVVVTAGGQGGTGSAGPAATFQSVGVPGGLTASYADSSIQAGWSAAPGASGYTVAVTRDGRPLSPPPAIAFSGTSCTLTSGEFASGGSFTVAVTGSSAQMTGAPAAVTVDVGVLPAPRGLRLESGPGTVWAAWSAVPGAEGYQLQALDASGDPLVPQPAVQVDAAACTATLSGGTLAEGQVVQVRVRATAATLGGEWSAAVEVAIAWLPAPAAMDVVFDEPGRTMSVALDPVAGASGYQVEVLDAGGGPLSPPLLAAVPPWEFGVPQLAGASGCRVRARATAAAATGAWTDEVALELAALAAPVLAVTFTPTAVRAAFDPVPGATSYQAELLDGGGAPLSPPVRDAGVGSPLSLSAHGLAAGAQYQVRVRALWSA